MNILDKFEIAKIEDRLTKILWAEYSYVKEDMWLDVTNITVDYNGLEEEPDIALKLRYGYTPKDEQDKRWQYDIELMIKSWDLEFIAGQFTQALVEKGY